MKASANPIIQKTEKAVQRLLEECRKNSALYQSNPRAIAQVNRTGKWLLSAIAQLDKEPEIHKECQQ